MKEMDKYICQVCGSREDENNQICHLCYAKMGKDWKRWLKYILK